jgi:hypothetical protein
MDIGDTLTLRSHIGGLMDDERIQLHVPGRSREPEQDETIIRSSVQILHIVQKYQFNYSM